MPRGLIGVTMWRQPASSMNWAAVAISSVVPTRPAALLAIMAWSPAAPGPDISSWANGVRMMPGLMELTRAPRSLQVTPAPWTRRWLARLDNAYAYPELVTASG